ncbi:MAG: L-threonylcarbamoyladenylate synthase [Crocinitomicaceae bacterium]|nr:L-threonylcarbamoyladenylate synthase [Crocinitomicaceae bacterium]MDG1776886.1 L-threonylcarbamoyladenylate synthase [Crocinitomicaceae bacterium]
MKEIVEILKSGGTILYPTDTIWGLGCDATNEEACQKILDLKQRPEHKSFVILVDDFPMLQRYIPEFQEVCYDLADLAVKPLTIIYPNAKGLAPSILAKDGSVGIRITKDPTCIKLIRGLRKPIVSTSANISGDKNPVNYETVSAEIKNGADHIVKERLTEKMNTPSQIIKIGLRGDIEIIRK